MNSVSIGGSARATKKRISLNPLPVASRLAEFIASTDHAGKGAWDNNKEIPASAWIWALLFVALFLLLPWIGQAVGFQR